MHSRYVKLCRACRVGVSHTDTTTPQEKWRLRSSASCSSQGAFVVHAKSQPKGGPHLRAKHRKTEGSVSRRQRYVCLSVSTGYGNTRLWVIRMSRHVMCKTPIIASDRSDPGTCLYFSFVSFYFHNDVADECLGDHGVAWRVSWNNVDMCA